MTSMSELNGKRILVLEEEASIAKLLADMLESLECIVVGPANRVAQGLSLLVETDVDAAILDVKIKGKPTGPVAEELIRRAIPWAFSTANEARELSRRYPFAPIVTKPYSSAQIQEVLVQLLAS